MSMALLDELVGITEEYLGPAAHRFIDRQIIFHLDKEPSEILPEDIPRLAVWMRVTVALLTEDRSLVEDFTQRVLELGEDDR